MCCFRWHRGQWLVTFDFEILQQYNEVDWITKIERNQYFFENKEQRNIVWKRKFDITETTQWTDGWIWRLHVRLDVAAKCAVESIIKSKTSCRVLCRTIDVARWLGDSRASVTSFTSSKYLSRAGKRVVAESRHEISRSRSSRVFLSCTMWSKILSLFKQCFYQVFSDRIRQSQV